MDEEKPMVREREIGCRTAVRASVGGKAAAASTRSSASNPYLRFEGIFFFVLELP